MALTGRTYITDVPPIVAPPGGLFDVAPPRPSQDGELLGIIFQSQSLSGEFVDLDGADCLESSATKEFDGFEFVTGDPFQIYAGVNCGLMGNPAGFGAEATARLKQREQFLVERHLWEEILPAEGVDLTPGGVAVSPKIALGLLEEYAGKVYAGTPIIHAGKRLTVFFTSDQVFRDGSKLVTKGGSDYVDGAGYFDLNGPGAPVGTPVITKGAAASGGAFAAGTYFWVVTATTAEGETVASNEVTATLTANQQQPLNWTAITGATGYKIYRGTAAGAEHTLVAAVGAVATYTDTGTAGTIGTPPETGDAGNGAEVGAGTGNVWMYVTGRIVNIEGALDSFMAVDAPNNAQMGLGERTLVTAVDNFVAGIRVVLE